MSDIQTIIVTLKTSNAKDWAATNDPIYLGVVGSGGGGEFPLFAESFDDYKAGSEVIYLMGDSYLGEDLKNRHLPIKTPPEWESNNPLIRKIDLNNVHYVYLRKWGHKDPDKDDSWLMASVTVELIGEIPFGGKRIFQKQDEIRLSKETGLQVWIPEIRV